jgi:hypothetical protein
MTAGKGRLKPWMRVDVPLREVSGVCLRRGRGGAMTLLAVGDRVATAAWVRLPRKDSDPLEWETVDITSLKGSRLPRKNPQIEAVCADGKGRVLLLQESPSRVELIDLARACAVACIDLEVPGRGELAESWADPHSSRGEGVVLLPGGHLLVAKEKDPPVLLEFGPRGARSRGLRRGSALTPGAAWPIEPGEHRYVPLAVWWPDRALRRACEDFSDLEVGPDGRLYLLSDQSAAIARLGELTAGGGTATLQACWRLRKIKGKPEGLAFTPKGRAIVALDTRKPRGNLVVFDPPIAISS